MDDRQACIAFNLVEGVGSVGLKKLSAAHGGIAAAWMAREDKTGRDGKPVDILAELDRAARNGVTILTPVDDGYPESLRSIESHPLALYVKGDASILSKAAVALVGTRKPSQYGLDQALRFAHDLAGAGYVVVSGLALGIDAAAHRGALAAGGLTTGVIGSGLNCFYPQENLQLAREIVEKGGAIVSEFPFGHAPDRRTFPQRNHVIAGLSRGVLAIEAPAKSGTMITMRIAANLSRAVMALPGRVDNQAGMGCLALIRDGATLVRSPEDVIEELTALPGLRRRALAPGNAVPAAPRPAARAPCAAPPAPPNLDGLDDDERTILAELTPDGISYDHLTRKTGMDVGKVIATSMALAVDKRARILPGGLVALWA